MFNLYLSYGRTLLAMSLTKDAREKFVLAHKHKMNIESLYLYFKTYLQTKKKRKV